MSPSFEGFELARVDTGEATIRVRYGGSGPPLLLLHGHPQTHAMWHGVGPLLADDFTVVAADLRGYGDSSKPPTTDDHEPYSKRAMARDHVRRAVVRRPRRLARLGERRPRPSLDCGHYLAEEAPHETAADCGRSSASGGRNGGRSAARPTRR